MVHYDIAWPAIADMNYLNSVIRVIKLLNMGNFYQSRTVLYQRLVVKFINLSTIQGQITHCLYIFCSVKMCPHQFQNRVVFYCIHLMAGILLITIFPFLFYRVDDLLKIIKWILKPKLFPYLYVQIAYLPHVHVYF